MALGKLLSNATHLRTLTLSNNYDFLSTPEAVRPIAHALAVNKSVTSLQLDYCGLDDEGVAALVDGLKQNTTLKELDLEGNNLTDYAAKSLLELLAVNKTLNRIELGESSLLSDEALRRISAALSGSV